ncbi:MAG: hypothetical protein KJO40_20330 [Deltaproteobacteria bacterium]|nr:hypothetical protein [Deltaproteobacteria bacterium]NND28061.1 hypothetical protein [Myxococcales bacterium]MBT8464498.1 hypothetical protein [Deltaproteobacteria bacterium]MBT8480981.1 hypothetical protein [Deltaproteobacteria bacterium]NNK09087.1 hypothetical protein [Myxococcales bacterium]
MHALIASRRRSPTHRSSTRCTSWSSAAEAAGFYGGPYGHGFDAGFPRVALDPKRNAVAGWYQSDGTSHNIWANWFE